MLEARSQRTFAVAIDKVENHPSAQASHCAATPSIRRARRDQRSGGGAAGQRRLVAAHGSRDVFEPGCDPTPGVVVLGRHHVEGHADHGRRADHLADERLRLARLDECQLRSARVHEVPMAEPFRLIPRRGLGEPAEGAAQHLRDRPLSIRRVVGQMRRARAVPNALDARTGSTSLYSSTNRRRSHGPSRAADPNRRDLGAARYGVAGGQEVWWPGYAPSRIRRRGGGRSAPPCRCARRARRRR